MKKVSEEKHRVSMYIYSVDREYSSVFTVHGTPMYGTLYNVIHHMVHPVHGTIYHLFFSPLNFAQEIKMTSF